MVVNLFGKNFRLFDLSHTLHPGVPSWSGSCGFKASIVVDYNEGCRVLNFETEAGIGTHMDAPSHFIPEGEDISALPIEHFIVPLSVLHLSKIADPDYLISTKDLLDFEHKYGPIPDRAFVAANTGWHKRWDKPFEYRNCDMAGKMHFPGFAKEAAMLLLERNISGIGIDTLSPDGGNLEFPVHHVLLDARKFIIENLNNLEVLSPSGGYVIAFPPKIREATEANLRVVALYPYEEEKIKTR